MLSRDGQSLAWVATLDHIERHQQSAVYMPAALWVALDLIEYGLAPGGRFAFNEFEPRFAGLLQRAGLSGSERAWEPFFHLSRAAQVWDLYQHDQPARADTLPGGRPKSLGQLLRIADSARMRPALLREVDSIEGRRFLRDELLARLTAEGSDAARQLANALRGDGLVLCQSSDEIARVLDTFNRDAALYEDRTRHILRTTEYWVWDPNTDCFGPGKFVGYKRMSFPAYERGLQGDTSGAKFDGHLTQVAIRRALRADFGPSENLSLRLKQWAERLLGVGALDRVLESKWQFACLPSHRNYWGLLANPARYRIDEAARELDTDTWTIPQGDLDVGDRIAFWRTLGADGHRGIIALAEVLSPPSVREKLPESLQYWKIKPAVAEQRRILFRYVLPPRVPLWLAPESQAVLSALSVSRGQGTKAYRIEPEAWWRLVDALGGWPEEEEADEAAVAAQQAARSGGRGSRQGRQMSPQARKAIEELAMERATAHFRLQGYRVEDTSKGNPYDLRCTRGDETLYVEVKGTTSLGEEVLLTPGEVRFAEANADQMVLFIVHSIELPTGPDEDLPARGGIPVWEQPWRLKRESLKILTYGYRPLGSREDSPR